MPDGILYYLNLHWAIPFWVRSRSLDTFKMKFYATTVNNSFQSLTIFGHGKLHLRCCIGFELNIVTWSMKILKGSGRAPLRSSAVLRKYEILTLLNVLKIHSQSFFAWCFLESTKWSYYQLTDICRLRLC